MTGYVGADGLNRDDQGCRGIFLATLCYTNHLTPNATAVWHEQQDLPNIPAYSEQERGGQQIPGAKAIVFTVPLTFRLGIGTSLTTLLARLRIDRNYFSVVIDHGINSSTVKQANRDVGLS